MEGAVTRARYASAPSRISTVTRIISVFPFPSLLLSGGRVPRMPGTSIVGGDHTEATCNKGWDDAVPFPPRLREAVQKHDGARSLPRRDEMEAQAGFYVGHPVRNVRQVLLRGHNLFSCQR